MEEGGDEGGRWWCAGRARRGRRVRARARGSGRVTGARKVSGTGGRAGRGTHPHAVKTAPRANVTNAQASAKVTCSSGAIPTTGPTRVGRSGEARRATRGRRARPRTGARRASAIFNERVTSAPSSLSSRSGISPAPIPRRGPHPRARVRSRRGAASSNGNARQNAMGKGMDLDAWIAKVRSRSPVPPTPPSAGPAGPAASFEIRAFAPVAPAVADPPPADVPPLPLPARPPPSPTSIRSNSASPWRSPSSRLCART